MKTKLSLILCLFLSISAVNATSTAEIIRQLQGQTDTEEQTSTQPTHNQGIGVQIGGARKQQSIYQQRATTTDDKLTIKVADKHGVKYLQLDPTGRWLADSSEDPNYRSYGSWVDALGYNRQGDKYCSALQSICMERKFCKESIAVCQDLGEDVFYSDNNIEWVRVGQKYCDSDTRCKYTPPCIGEKCVTDTVAGLTGVSAGEIVDYDSKTPTPYKYQPHRSTENIVPGCATEEINRQAYERYILMATNVIKETLGSTTYDEKLDEALKRCQQAGQVFINLITGAGGLGGGWFKGGIDWKGAAEKVMTQAGKLLVSLRNQLIGNVCNMLLDKAKGFIGKINDFLGVFYDLPYGLGMVQIDVVITDGTPSITKDVTLKSFPTVDELADEIWQ